MQLLPNSTSNREKLVNIWENSIYNTKIFSQACTKEYLLALRERANKISQLNPRKSKKGKLVLIYDDNLPRTQ